MKNIKRILIVGANPYNGNKGVAALAYSAIILVNKILLDNNLDGEILVYNHEFQDTYDYIETPKGKIYFKNVYPSNVFGGKNLLKTIFSKWRLYNLKEFLKADCILNVAGGDSFSDIYGNANFNILNNINRMARLFKKKYLFLPQTIGPFTDKKIELRAIKSLRMATVILSRDNESSDYLKKYENLPKVYSVVDLAFALPYVSIERGNDQSNHIGINISQTLWFSDKNNKFSLKTNYREFTENLISRLLADENNIVHIIPHVTDSRDSDLNEYRLCYRFWQKHRHPRLLLAPFFLSPIDAKNYISSLNLFLGARMHACIAAFSSNTPVIPIAYSRKFSGLFVKTLNYPYILDLSLCEVSVNEAMLMITEMCKNQNKIIADIFNRNQTIANKKIEEIEKVLTDFII